MRFEHIGADAASDRAGPGALGDQVDRHPLFLQFDIGALAGLLQQGVEDRGARGIGGVDDAPMAMAALAGEVELEAAVLAPCSSSRVKARLFDRHWMASRLCSTVKVRRPRGTGRHRR